MSEGSYWTDDRLKRLEAEIDAFEEVAKSHGLRLLTERKKQLRDLARSCSDSNVRDILGRAAPLIAKQPSEVYRAIGLARGHVQTLRYLRK